MPTLTTLSAALSALIAAPVTAGGDPVGNEFTYQGQLAQDGQPLNGQIDLTATLWDALGGGSQVGSTINFIGLDVVDGLLQLPLDFGPDVFDGTARWLQLEVDGNTLVPRQPLNAVPYAQFALDGVGGGASPWETNGDDIHYSVGNVGVGIDAPVTPLAFANAVGGKITLFESGNNQFGFGIQPSLMQLYTPTIVADIAFGTGRSDGFTERFRFTGDGRLGIGVPDPDAPLSFANVFGDKIAMWDAGSNYYGLGIQGNLMQFYTANDAADIAFGTGNSNSFDEVMRITGDGNLGIRTTTPAAMLDIDTAVLAERNAADAGALTLLGANGTANVLLTNVLGSPSSGAIGVFDDLGNVRVSIQTSAGNGIVSADVIEAGTKNFRIDHPLTPTDKYLYHYSVESPDMKTVYDGIVTLDEAGVARVELPDYFDALNEDFRYQLTCIGGFANVYIGEEVRDNVFVIAGGTAGLRVSWQITGIRKDPYAVTLRKQRGDTVEIDKPVHKRGTYLHPAAYGVANPTDVAECAGGLR